MTTTDRPPLPSPLGQVIEGGVVTPLGAWEPLDSAPEGEPVLILYTTSVWESARQTTSVRVAVADMILDNEGNQRWNFTLGGLVQLREIRAWARIILPDGSLPVLHTKRYVPTTYQRYNG